MRIVCFGAIGKTLTSLPRHPQASPRHTRANNTVCQISLEDSIGFRHILMSGTIHILSTYRTSLQIFQRKSTRSYPTSPWPEAPQEAPILGRSSSRAADLRCIAVQRLWRSSRDAGIAMVPIARKMLDVTGQGPGPIVRAGLAGLPLIGGARTLRRNDR
jgi:hypothetical protein